MKEWKKEFGPIDSAGVRVPAVVAVEVYSAASVGVVPRWDADTVTVTIWLLVSLLRWHRQS